MKICIDITEMIKVDFISGIQRVVKEVTTRWIRDGKEICLLFYDSKKNVFKVVDSQKYYDFYTGKTKDKKLFSKKEMRINDFNKNCIFFDMDSVWMNPLKRSYLLPELKKRGTKIAAQIYDIIPVTEAQYCHEFTTLSFLEYIGAQIQYSDLIIANAQATIDAIDNLIQGTEVSAINGKVVKLGSDIRKSSGEKEVRKEIMDITEKGQYILMVGTIEPRKNHKFVLEAFEKELFGKGINLIFAGRIGWNVEKFVSYVTGHDKINKQLFFINDASDQEIVHLYKNALLVAFPSYNEGFGLPIIEAFDQGALVLAADIPVLKEVGGEYCKYFSLENTDEFVKEVLFYLENKDEYTKDKARIAEYKRYTWDECAEQMRKEIEQLG